MRVVDLTRECQYCEDTPRGVRVRCGRLATSFVIARAGRGVHQASFRCDAHAGKLNDTVLMAPVHTTIKQNYTFGLGYKP